LENTKNFSKYFKQTNLHIFTSEFLLKQFASFEGESKKVIFNGVVPAAMELNRTFNPNKIRFGIVGRINNQKNQKEVIELFNRIILLNNYDIELHIIGAGDNEFLNWFKGIQSKFIFYHEFLDRYVIYDKFDILISNASNEAFGRTIAEANYSGIPVILRNSGAFPELVKDGVNGFLYEDLIALEVFIKSLSEIKRIEFETFSKNCLGFAKEIFNHITLSKKVLKEIRKLY
jgi:glycosyltransferase involved in cell wall biosynthesis